MIKILICCGGGFSSSSMTVKVQKEIKEKGYEDKVSVEFCPFTLAFEVMDNFDIIMACPHLRFSVTEFLKRHGDRRIPIYLLPPKMYGTMYIDDVYEDAEDLLQIWKDNKTNPIYFSGEENVLRIKRIHSHRKEQEKT